MIHPTLQLCEELYIHAARDAVWARFCRLVDWPRWQPGVVRAAWVQGQSWQEGAHFALDAAGSGAGQTQLFIIRMVVPADTTVWESTGAGQSVVYSLHLADQVGGCKVSLRCTFHGWSSLLKRLTSANETAKLHTILSALKTDIERPDSRR